MPHVTLEGSVDIREFLAGYRPVVLKGPREILKLQHAYLSTTDDEVLIEALAKEDGPAVRFLVQILIRDAVATVKIYPGNDPEKTLGVKKIIALVARRLKEQNPAVRYGTTNLKEFLLQDIDPLAVFK